MGIPPAVRVSRCADLLSCTCVARGRIQGGCLELDKEKTGWVIELKEKERQIF